MKKKQAWKVMSAVLAGTLVFSDAVPLRASASAGTEKSAVQNETVSGTENGTETKTKRAAVKGYGCPLRAFSLSGFLHHIRTNQKLSRIY